MTIMSVLSAAKLNAGDWIAVHCSSGKNGVTVGEAYGASFRYIRQPSFLSDTGGGGTDGKRGGVCKQCRGSQCGRD